VGDSRCRDVLLDPDVRRMGVLSLACLVPSYMELGTTSSNATATLEHTTSAPARHELHRLPWLYLSG
jgi:hypothetical protein